MSGQLGPLVRLRWRMVRGVRARLGFALLSAAVPALCLATVVAGRLLPQDRSIDVLLLAPTAYLSVAVLAALAPLVAGGGNELFPSEQLAAYPVTARTQYLASLALTPLNLAWTTQVAALLGLTAYVTPAPARLSLALATCLAYVAVVTVVGQAVGWAVVGTRTRRRGRQATWGLAGALLGLALATVATGQVGELLDRSPTTWVVIGAASGRPGLYHQWALITVALVLLAFVGDRLGRLACAWALRQPGEATGRLDARPLRRRSPAASTHRALLALDRASVWRSGSLRRGLLVLSVLPGGVAAVAGLDWASMVLLPGLVASGAGLLFGVNAFCLDGAGAVWLGSLPGRPADAFWSKARVTAETCLAAVVLTLLAGSARAGAAPTAAEVTALVACTAVVLLRVVALSMELSVRRPHRADLRGPRDTPAPPGVMAAYSARLALTTTLVAVLFSALAEVAPWQWPLYVAVPFLLLSARRLLVAGRAWASPAVRARVISVVAAG